MRSAKASGFIVILMLASCLVVQAQQKKHDTQADEAKVRDMVAYLSYFLNTIGSSSTDASDKDVLITQSFSKIFRDAKVQVEDDLDPHRSTPTYKDVQAYLKDVDFFFTNVKFDLSIEKITSQQNVNGQLYYRVELTRNLNGTTATGVVINNTIPRYIEINYDPAQQDLKIVSIYTHEYDESEMLKGWWSQLSYEWQQIFQHRLNLTDSVGLNDIRDMMSLQDLDLSNNGLIQNIEPLSRLTALRTLDLSGTAITDLAPARNLTALTSLNLSNTAVEDLSPLRYSLKLERLNISRTRVSDVSVLELMSNLHDLALAGTPVRDFSALANLQELETLDVSNTTLNSFSTLGSLGALTTLKASGDPATDFRSLATLTKLQTLNLDSTQLKDLSTLAALTNLQVLYVNNTRVDTLKSLVKLPQLERIYCDHTGVTRKTADMFMAAHKGVLVIFDSEDLRSWWSTLTSPWKKVLSKAAQTNADPTKEELVKITYLDSINIGSNKDIIGLDPLRRLPNLRVLVADNTPIIDLAPVRDLHDLSYLDVSNSLINSLDPLRDLKKLKEVHADACRIHDLSPLAEHAQLEKVYVDKSGIDDSNVFDFLRRSPACLVVYNTTRFNMWWEGLSAGWKKALEKEGVKGSPSREEIHRLVELPKLTLEGSGLAELSPLVVFLRLRELSVSGTAVSDLTPLSSIPTLRSLKVSACPIHDLRPLSALDELEELDVSNTAVDDLEPISGLQQLIRLDISGTQVKRLDPLERLTNLAALDCSNSNVKKLDPIYNLPLKVLKCYNTSISSHRIDDFRGLQPDCDVIYYR